MSRVSAECALWNADASDRAARGTGTSRRRITSHCDLVLTASHRQRDPAREAGGGISSDPTLDLASHGAIPARPPRLARPRDPPAIQAELTQSYERDPSSGGCPCEGVIVAFPSARIPCTAERRIPRGARAYRFNRQGSRFCPGHAGSPIKTLLRTDSLPPVRSLPIFKVLYIPDPLRRLASERGRIFPGCRVLAKLLQLAASTTAATASKADSRDESHGLVTLLWRRSSRQPR